MMFFVYILASQPHGTLYVGVTSHLVQRIWEHKCKAVPGFTAKYGVDRLVWFEPHQDWESAIRREKRSRSGNARGRSN
jgi:putative endonuclease